MAAWIEACGAEDIDEEDVIRFDHDGRTFAIYRTGRRPLLRHGRTVHA